MSVLKYFKNIPRSPPHRATGLKCKFIFFQIRNEVPEKKGPVARWGGDRPPLSPAGGATGPPGGPTGLSPLGWATGACRPWGGRQGPVARWGGDRPPLFFPPGTSLQI